MNRTLQPVVQRIGPGVKPPRLIFKVEPEYTPEARNANVQATVAFEIVVSEQGKATNITVLSPAGFGLDRRAEAAIRRWVFEPGQMGGKAIPILATVDVNFRFQDVPFDRKAEDRRKNFNVALARVSNEDGTLAAAAAHAMEQLAKEKFAPAIYQMSLLYGSGRIVPCDPDCGAALLADAAKRNYGPAMHEVCMRLLTGASVCQYRLATLLSTPPEGDQRKTIEAIAWLELAAGQGYTEARKLLAVERHKLTAEQIGHVNGLKKLLVHK